MRIALMTLASIPMTYGLTQAWLSAAVSERFWTGLNGLLQQNFGLASDLELLLVLWVSFSLSFALVAACAYAAALLRPLRDTPAIRPVRETFYATLAGLLAVTAAGFLVWALG